MPYLRFKGFPTEFLKMLAPRIVEEFAQIVNITKEKVKIESLVTEAITQVPLSVEILMAPRKQEIHDAAAAMLNRLLKEYGYEQIHLFFIILNPRLYYRNGEPLASGSSTYAPSEGVSYHGMT
ncbi:DUF1904 domain-containing protein [Paenibacillus doosanensis]|uniref:DUF1904 domain-containing protein n=1 Tax=Paenibacillus konkukensis TaxID=2020716 RepID=A0ABY4RRL8_9BACL|nr:MULTISPECIES: DUF1904 family protein [Paenibacillus]MCS7462092.1 DUF1904 domain-containing protein [Paenibacillus doosanensis]UQZ85161.1 hypothetical protein SK3146_04444 [Paenibacillus konkukensis]